MYKFRLNVVTDNEFEVHNCLVNAFAHTEHGIKVYLANRPGKGIVEFEFVADVPCCLSLESIKEALPMVADYNIRVSFVWC